MYLDLDVSCIYIYIYLCIFIWCIHTHIFIFVYTQVSTYIYIYTHTHIFVSSIHIYIYIYGNRYVIYIYTNKQTNISTETAEIFSEVCSSATRRRSVASPSCRAAGNPPGQAPIRGGHGRQSCGFNGEARYPVENHRETIGKWCLNGVLMAFQWDVMVFNDGFIGVYGIDPLVRINITKENHHFYLEHSR